MFELPLAINPADGTRFIRPDYREQPVGAPDTILSYALLATLPLHIGLFGKRKERDRHLSDVREFLRVSHETNRANPVGLDLNC